MPSLTRDGVQIYYEEKGSGPPPVVLIHGLACDLTQFEKQVSYFSRSHRAVAIDLRGHGRSDKPDQDYTTETYADDVVSLCNELGLYRPVLVGHSLGGSVCLDIAARYPDLPAAVVALDANILVPDTSKEMLAPLAGAMYSPAWADALVGFMNSAFLPSDNQARKETILAAMRTAPQRMVASTFTNVFGGYDDAAAIGKLRTPFLYVDFGSPNCDLAKFRELYPELVTGQTVGAGHWAHLEVPEQVNGMIERFIEIAVREPVSA